MKYTKIICLLLIVAFTSSCASMLPQKFQTKYKTDDEFTGVGYEFALDWNLWK